MATATEAPEAPAASSAPAPPRRGGKLLLILSIVGVIVTIQVVLTLLLMPKAQTEKAEPKEAQKAESEAVVDEAEHAEVNLGDFNCTNNTAAPGVVIHLDFKLTAITSPKQESTLQGLLKSHQARIRQIVGKIVRSSNLEDLNDPNLGTIKRLVREEVNRLLRKSLITEVVVIDVRHVEQ